MKNRIRCVRDHRYRPPSREWVVLRTDDSAYVVFRDAMSRWVVDTFGDTPMERGVPYTTQDAQRAFLVAKGTLTAMEARQLDRGNRGGYSAN